MNDILPIFLPIPDLREYVDSRLASGALAAGRYVKSACVRAVPGTPGERVVTVLKNGLEETVNTVGTDPESGEPDWIVTCAGG